MSMQRKLIIHLMNCSTFKDFACLADIDDKNNYLISPDSDML